jgi:hypothetical protein
VAQAAAQSSEHRRNAQPNVADRGFGENERGESNDSDQDNEGSPEANQSPQRERDERPHRTAPLDHQIH